LKKTGSTASILVIVIIIALIMVVVWGAFRFSSYKIGGGGFSVQWIGLHSLISEGMSPYSDQVTSQIAESGVSPSSFVKPNSVKYTSPLYSGIVVFPFALIDNETISHAIWMILQLGAIIAIILVAIKLTNWKPAWYIFLLFAGFTIISFHSIIPWLDGGLPVWATLFLVSGLMAISHERNEIAGILLGLAFIQPQMVILPVILILIWAASNRRRIIILWFFVTLIFLSVIASFLVPDWTVQYIRLLYNFKNNFPPGSPIVLFTNQWPGLGRQLGWLVGVILVAILVYEWWVVLRKEFRWCLWTVCLTIVISQWIGIPTIPAQFILMLLPLILVAGMLAERWPRGGNWAAVLLSIILFVWEWGLVYMDFIGGVKFAYLNLMIPLPLILFIGLYWVRWWAIKPRRLRVEEMTFSGSY
jgi:hypothetical protein